MATKRTKADKLQRSIERTDKRTDARPDESVPAPKQNAKLPDNRTSALIPTRP